MICEKCNTINGDDARFCSQCGVNLPAFGQKSFNSDWFIVLYFASICFSWIARTLSQRLFGASFEGIAKYVFIVTMLVSVASSVMIVFAVRDKTLRIICLVVAIIMAIASFYGSLAWIMR